MTERLRRHAEIIGYAAIALAVLLPLFAPGFILTIDMVFTPHPSIPAEVSNDFIFRTALHALSFVLPGDILQKILLFGILLFAGIGAQRLSLYLFAKTDAVTRWVAFAAGMLYMFNPFIYGRFMAGQYVVLLGYALLPFFVRAFLKFASNPSKKDLFAAICWALALSVTSIHMFGLAVIASLVIIVFYIWKKRHEAVYLKKIFLYLGAGTGLLAILSSYWLVPVLAGRSTLNTATAQFSASDFSAFATDGGLFSVLQLKGFWLEAQQLFMSAGEPLPLSGVWQLLLWGIIATGIIYTWKSRKTVAAIFGAVGLLAIFFAVDSPLSQWFVAHMPGYREPHKLVALLALAFSVFFAFGARALVSNAKNFQAAAIAGLVLLPLLVTPAMLWGFHGQLKPTDYPKDWYVLNKKLVVEDKILFLPWHMYMKFSFTEHIVANPADPFFNARLITSQDPEFAGSSPPQVDDTAQKLNADILPAAPNQTTLGSQLHPMGITHVLLAKEGDWREYGYLDRQADLRLDDETPAYKLYKVEEGKR